MTSFRYSWVMPDCLPFSADPVDATPSRDSARRPLRVRVSMPVHLEIAPGQLVKAIVDDLSKDGFRLRSRAALAVGQRVTMHTPRETLDCELRWVEGLTAGGVFSEDSYAAAW